MIQQSDIFIQVFEIKNKKKLYISQLEALRIITIMSNELRISLFTRKDT